jgi:hypothetical protein
MRRVLSRLGGRDAIASFTARSPPSAASSFCSSIEQQRGGLGIDGHAVAPRPENGAEVSTDLALA